MNASKEPIYYFAYGSDMNQEQIVSRCNHSKFMSIATLPDHGVAFFGNSDKWDGALESLIDQPSNVTWGVVYEISSTDMDYLDVFHAARLDGTGITFQYPVDVTGTDGKVYPAYTYRKSALSDPNLPSREYLDYIIASAVSYCFPIEYIKQLQDIKAKNASYPVPKSNSLTKAWLAAHACNCG